MTISVGRSMDLLRSSSCIQYHHERTGCPSIGGTRDCTSSVHVERIRLWAPARMAMPVAQIFQHPTRLLVQPFSQGDACCNAAAPITAETVAASSRRNPRGCPHLTGPWSSEHVFTVGVTNPVLRLTTSETVITLRTVMVLVKSAAIPFRCANLC